jgi:predicted amidohydrolase YtcJ
MNFCTFELQTLRSQPPNLEEFSKEERIKEVLQVITPPQELSLRRAAAAYNVPETTLRRRHARKMPQRDTRPKSSNLQKTEEEALRQYIKKLYAQGFAPTLHSVEDVANQLRAARGDKAYWPKMGLKLH